MMPTPCAEKRRNGWRAAWASCRSSARGQLRAEPAPHSASTRWAVALRPRPSFTAVAGIDVRRGLERHVVAVGVGEVEAAAVVVVIFRSPASPGNPPEKRGT